MSTADAMPLPRPAQPASHRVLTEVETVDPIRSNRSVDTSRALNADSPSYHPPPSHTRMFGRDGEIALIRAAVDRLPNSGGALLVRGAAGIGKSSLLAI